MLYKNGIRSFGGILGWKKGSVVVASGLVENRLFFPCVLPQVAEKVCVEEFERKRYEEKIMKYLQQALFSKTKIFIFCNDDIIN